MANHHLIRQLRQDSTYVDQLFKNPKDVRHNYNNFVIGASEMLWGKKLPNGKRFDANSSIALYELSLSLDQRIIVQAVEQSWLRSSFYNFPDEKVFYEYQGVNPADTVYVPFQLEMTGYDRTATNESSRLLPAQNPNEIKTIRAAVSPIRRDIRAMQEGFELTLADLELAAAKNLPVQQELTSRVARDLMMGEQGYAFKYQSAGTYTAPEGQGLFYNTAISTSITWTAGAILNGATTGRAIVDEFVRIRGAILTATDGVFEQMQNPMCVLMSLSNRNQLDRTYSDLEGQSAIAYLTVRGFRIIGMPIMGDNQMYFYYNDPMNIELSTARQVEAQPQSYEARKTAWFFPFRLVTAGLTVKRPEAIYSVSGENPS